MTSNSTSTPPKGSGLGSLYANLLGDESTNGKDGSPAAATGSTGASISRAPVTFKQENSGDTSVGGEEAERKRTMNAAALRFQPTKRPQLSSQKAKARSTVISKPPATAAPAAAPAAASRPSEGGNSTQRPPPQVKSTLADWTAADDDVNGYYEGEKRQRGGRKKRKKNKEASVVVQNWDDIYDPSRPNNYEEYKNSDEKVREVREWKDRLYAHRMRRSRTSDLDSEDDRPARKGPANPQFAPPPGLNFAPPPNLDTPVQPPPSEEPKPFLEAHEDQTGDDAYTRRMRMSQQHPVPPPPPPPPPPAEDEYTPSEPAQFTPSQPPPPPPPPSAPEALISRAPVRYSLPEAPKEIPKNEKELAAALDGDTNDDVEMRDQDQPAEGDEARSSRPGQQGFAARLMSKYGWTKGSGLGATGSGIINPLRVQVEKQKKKPDSEGGGFVIPGGRGKILGGKKLAGSETEGKFGKMSNVIVLRGMVDGMDIQAEIASGTLLQEIGEECGDKYGRVERVFIHPSNPPKVFINFTSELSGLRAVNALEGRVFNGNTIDARFYDSHAFGKGNYDES